MKLDQLAMANSFPWYGYMLRREDGHFLRILRRILRLKVKGRKEGWREHGISR